MRRAVSAFPVVAVAGLLTACGSSAVPEPAPVPVATAGEALSQCDGNGLVRYIGHPLVQRGDPLPAEGGYVSWENLPADNRVLGPGVHATMDFRPDRLNVVIDAQRRILRLYCG